MKGKPLLHILWISAHYLLNCGFCGQKMTKIGPKKWAPNQKEVSFWPFQPLYGCYFILKAFYYNSAQQEISFAAKFMSIVPLLTN